MRQRFHFSSIWWTYRKIVTFNLTWSRKFRVSTTIHLKLRLSSLLDISHAHPRELHVYVLNFTCTMSLIWLFPFKSIDPIIWAPPPPLFPLLIWVLPFSLWNLYWEYFGFLTYLTREKKGRKSWGTFSVIEFFLKLWWDQKLTD